MKKLLPPQAILDLRQLLKNEIAEKTIDAMSDEDISYIGIFMLEVYQQVLYIKSRS